ncbi:SDR family oxidoreductase [Saccharothrix obliqua]|uniref:SDR family oxidoreductase n=1 Tax=Saccharothrix obliqua TaxID=2861747 RepID=UPI001C5DEE1D|nr:SDR family oxidoreductase [Saccharothrix obliqua]MBW4720476.1 SDR family oxidoreductase [Saccharothrix obliqua]
MTEQPSGAAIAVTGSTGNLGGRVARRLAAGGVAQRLLVRDTTRAPELPGATAVVADYGDREAVRAALAGAERVLMVSAPETADRVDLHRSFVDAAAEAGVGHLVYISFYGAAPDAVFTLARDHFTTEEHIRASGLPHTFLRDNMYADFMPMLAGEDGVIRGPAGDGRVAAVALDDIADAAVAVLRDTAPHVGATYELTGPRALTLDEVAAVLSDATGRAVSYHRETVDEAYRSRAPYNAPDWLLDAWVSTYTAIAEGQLAGVTDDVRRLTGHPATPLAEVVRAAR